MALHDDRAQLTKPPAARHPAAPAAPWLLGGGLLWVAAALVGGADGSTRFYLAEVIWLVAQLCLLTGTVVLWRAGPHGGTRYGSAGFGVATLGRVIFVAAEAAALATGETQDDLLPAAALPTALGMILAGIAILRAGRWRGWARFVPLAVGAVPCVVMFPFAASSADGPPAASLVAWGMAFIALGAAAQRSGPAAVSLPR